jgi:chemotaxis protein MotB
MSGKNQPIIIVKKTIKHAGHHGGAWKVAYADFVTAMMAFFLVMWLVSQSNEVKAAVGGYFRDPGVFDAQGGQGILPGGDGVDPSAAPNSPEDVDEAYRVLEAAAAQIQDRLAGVPAFASLLEQVELTVTPDGLRIDLVDADESSFFASGSAGLRGEADQILGVIGQEIAALENDIVIEGYTDSRPYASTNRYTNWELSADRANAARRSLEEQGLPPSRVASVIGHADRILRFPDDPYDSGNRRVSILVKN